MDEEQLWGDLPKFHIFPWGLCGNGLIAHINSWLTLTPRFDSFLLFLQKIPVLKIPRLMRRTMQIGQIPGLNAENEFFL